MTLTLPRGKLFPKAINLLAHLIPISPITPIITKHKNSIQTVHCIDTARTRSHTHTYYTERALSVISVITIVTVGVSRCW